VRSFAARPARLPVDADGDEARRPLRRARGSTAAGFGLTHAHSADPPRSASLLSQGERQCGLLRRAEGRPSDPDDRAESLRRVRPSPDRWEARAVREDSERGDGVPCRAGGAREVGCWAFDRRGTAEQWIKEGKNAVKWTRPSCTSFRGNAARLRLHALAYDLASFLRALALSGRDRAVVPDHVAGEGGEDRGEGHRSRPLPRLPDARGSPSGAVRAPPRPDGQAAPARRGAMVTRAGLSRRSRPRADVHPPHVRRSPSRGRRSRGAPRRQPSASHQDTVSQKTVAGRGRSALHAAASRASARSSGKCRLNLDPPNISGRSPP